MDDAVARWSAALREVEVLEPWLTESQWDEHYWDEVAANVVRALRQVEIRPREALVAALRDAFPDVPLESDNAFYRDQLFSRLDLVVERATAPL